MKRLVLTLAICLGCLGILEAQNIWKPINGTGLLGVGPDGRIFAYDEYGKLTRSQDDGETWQIVLGQETGFTGHINPSCFAVSDEERIFVFNDNQQTVVYSDDGGDTWQQTTAISSCAMPDKAGLCVPTNDIMVVWAEEGEINYSLDGGETWDGGLASWTEDPWINDLIVNEAGDVYVSMSAGGCLSGGIIHSTLDDGLENWTSVAFSFTSIFHLEFDSEGNVVAGSNWDSTAPIPQESGFYLLPETNNFVIADNGIIYKCNMESHSAVLAYSLDHGEHFTEIGEYLPLVDIAPGGENARLFKGADNHLYFDGGGEYWKSIRDADRIIENFPLDNTHYVDAIQICATDDQLQFPLAINVENAESGPYYGCLNTQPNPAWFFVKMDEPGDVIININVQSDGFFDVDFCCWGPFSELPESSEELTQDKVVDCAYDPSPATCTIPSTAQTGEYFVLLVTNYANLPGDLTFTSGGGTGSLECPGTYPREWYYEIQNENGSITYQYLYQAGDTIINDEPTHILVKINTLYDKDLHQDVSHEYVYERDGKLYWWNKTLEEFTVLYDFGAQEGDSWVIKVGTETLTMHVDAVEETEYEGRTYRMLRVSDPEDLFSGNIVCGIGHLTSFFPERLMDNGDGIRVEGMRCYWNEGGLVFKYGDEDCDAVYSEVHGVEEDGPSTGSGDLTVYPNPTNGVLFVQTLHATSLPAETYRITNLMGQTLLAGQITNENQQINVSSLPQGMYFITIAGETRKFVVNY